MKGFIHQEGIATLSESAPEKGGFTSVEQKPTGQKQAVSNKSLSP